MPQDGIRDELRRLRSEKGSIKESLKELRSTPPQPEVAFLENLWVGAQQGYQDYIEAPILRAG